MDKMISLEKCQKILKAHGEEATIEEVKKIREGIVSEKLFEKARKVLSAKPSTRVTQYDDSKDFIFRRFLWCESCQKYLTSSYSRGKSGKRHPYYHCQVQKGCGRYPTKLVHDAFDDHLDNFKFPSSRVALYGEILRDVFAQNRKTKKGELEELQSEIYQLDQKLLNLEVRFVEGDIDKTTFKRVKSRFRSEILTLKERESSLELFKSDFEQFLDYGLNVLLNLGKLFRSETIEGKRIILGSMFGKKIIFQDGKVRTPELNQVLVYMSSISGGESFIDCDEKAMQNVALRGGGPDRSHFEHLQRIIDLRKTISVTF